MLHVYRIGVFRVDTFREVWPTNIAQQILITDKIIVNVCNFH